MCTWVRAFSLNLSVLKWLYREHSIRPPLLPSAQFSLSLLNNLSVKADLYLSSAQSQISTAHVHSRQVIIAIKPQVNDKSLCTVAHQTYFSKRRTHKANAACPEHEPPTVWFVTHPPLEDIERNPNCSSCDAESVIKSSLCNNSVKLLQFN